MASLFASGILVFYAIPQGVLLEQMSSKMGICLELDCEIFARYPCQQEQDIYCTCCSVMSLEI